MGQKENIFSRLPDALLPWFANNHRDLPWRKDREPYHIWISEIMLQQTRVEAVKGYYTRFLQTLPTLQDLAKADDELLHKLWEGLGYYSRVRNLKKAAIAVMENHGGIFPGEYHQVLALPGIGEYTAGAICSIAYDQKTPAVDGNVLRVASRLLNDATPIDRPEFKKSVNQMLAEVYPDRAGEFTQALMELGATVCGPNRKPECNSCPCKDFCLAHQEGTAESLPVKTPKKPRKHQKITVFIMEDDGYYALEKRENRGLLAGLWQFPNTSGHLSENQVTEYLLQHGILVKDILRRTEKQHIFTHVQWDMLGYYLTVSPTDDRCLWRTAAEIAASVALPTAFRIFWDLQDPFES